MEQKAQDSSSQQKLPAADVSPTSKHYSLTFKDVFKLCYYFRLNLLARLGLICCPLFVRPQCAQNGAAASAKLSNGRGAVTIVRLVETCRFKTSITRKGSESGAIESGVNSLRDSLNVCPGFGFGLQKRDDMASRRTRSATSFALPYGYLTPEASLPNEALRTSLTSLWRCRW